MFCSVWGQFDFQTCHQRLTRNISHFKAYCWKSADENIADVAVSAVRLEDLKQLENMNRAANNMSSLPYCDRNNEEKV